jgi:hypothetical protein
VPAGDRARLEHLCRYVLRPPIAQAALEREPDGMLLLRLRRTWRDGTRAIRFSPLELLEKLAAIVPKPRINLLVYHGAFAPNARAGLRTARRPVPSARRVAAARAAWRCVVHQRRPRCALRCRRPRQPPRGTSGRPPRPRRPRRIVATRARGTTHGRICSGARLPSTCSPVPRARR